MKRRYSIIDIGSNSVRYMGRNGEKRLVTTRLAEGLLETGALSAAAMARSLAAVKEYVERSAGEGLIPRAYATSAVRDAKNARVFLDMLLGECGIDADVLSGEREAEYALLGAGKGADGLVDIGGGSCQIVMHGWKASFPMGCVRAKEALEGAGTLAEMERRLEARCMPLFRFPRMYAENWTGVGGTITTLGALSLGLAEYDEAKVSAHALAREEIEALTKRLFDMGDGGRRNHPLLVDRHDVIIPGALLLLFVMRGAGVARLAVSDADGMEGYLFYLEALEAAEG